MAFTTVVIDHFLEQIVTSIRQIGQRKGAFTLVMLLPSSAHDTSEWNAVFSATWLDDVNVRQAIRMMMDALKSTLSESAFSRIQRVSILKTNHSLVHELTSDISVELGTVYRVRSFALSRAGIEEAIVLVSRPPSGASSASTPVVSNAV